MTLQGNLQGGDISFTPGGVQIFLKWAKNLQKAQKSNVVMLPRMKSQFLCSLHILSTLFKSQHYAQCDPVIKCESGPLTEAQLRMRLQLVLSTLGLPTTSLTYHALRRSGASLAFNNRFDFEAIKTHGAWGSDAIYRYLLSNSDSVQQVPRVVDEVALLKDV